MAYVSIGRHVGRSSLAERAGGWARAAWRAWGNRRAALQLARLDDRLLADIGLTRGDVDRALAVPLGQDPTLELAQLAAERRRAWLRR